MTESGQLGPEPYDGSGEQGYGDMLGSVGEAQQHDEALDAILSEVAPGAPRDTCEARAARIEMDRMFVERAAAEGFHGPATRKLLLAAYEYAHPVVSFLIRTGRIFGESSRLGRPVRRHPEDLWWTAEDRALLIQDCVHTGIFDIFYEYGLKKGRWDPTRRTALTTYAVNACILPFSSVYQKWWRDRVLERCSADLTEDLPARFHADQRQPDPAEQATARADAERLLRQMPPSLRDALLLRATQDATQAEAAALVGLTEKALESQLGRARKKLGPARNGPPRTRPDHTSFPSPEAGIAAQEGDRDR
jgi:sigma-70-like protein